MNLQWLEYGRNPLQLWFHRHRWWIRTGFALIVVPWILGHGYRVWTAEPANPVGMEQALSDARLRNAPPDHRDRTDALFSAMEAIPPVPGQASGSRATRATDLLKRPWDPGEPYVRRIMDYFADPATEEALGRVTRLGRGPFCLDPDHLPDQVAMIKRASRMLAWRARVRVAADGDYAGAARDLGTILRLASELENDGTFMSVVTGTPCRALALGELLLWCQEYDLTPDQVAVLDRLLEAWDLDAESLWRLILDKKYEKTIRLLDTLYTRDATGNGRLVPAAASPQVTGVSCPGYRWINLLSFAFPDRRTVERTIRAQYRSARDFTPAQATRRLKAFGRVYVLIVRAEVYHRGARLALALERYHHNCGHYPNTLTELVPRYVSDLPRDPFDRQPLHYRLEPDHSYVLWSVYENETDEGGHVSPPGGCEDDLVLPHARDRRG